MATTQLLNELQSFDTRISQSTKRLSAIEAALGNRSPLKSREDAAAQAQTLLKELRVQQKDTELAADSLRGKIQNLESKLYGGTVKSPRELQDMDQESKLLKTQLQALDEKLLGIIGQVEESQEKAQEVEQGLRQAEAEWQRGQDQLSEEKSELQSQVEELKAQRQKLAQQIGAKEMQLYQRLLISKSGLAVSQVERGMCRTCHVVQPTHVLQRARAGREPALCNNCGRILYAPP
jgi:predicted  nucleic acid-binding Zn-ribbon protein